MAFGVIVAAPTFGTASPHLIAGLGAGIGWQAVLGLTTGIGPGGCGRQTLMIREGPYDARSQWFRARAALVGLRDRAPAWLPVDLAAMFAAQGVDAPLVGSAVAAAAIGAGAPGGVAGGIAGDRHGRTATTVVAMAVSGTCAVLAGLLFGLELWLVTLVAVVWGVSVIADSPHSLPR